MFITYVIVTVITIVANAAVAGADLSRAKFVMANSDEVGVSNAWLPLLGILKAAGAVGLVFGLFHFRALGIAAAIGLILFFVGALITHIRARVFYNLYFPGLFLALAIGSLVLVVAER